MGAACASRRKRAPRLGGGLSRAARAERAAARRGARRAARALAHAARQLHTRGPRVRRVGALGGRQRRARVGRTAARASLLGASGALPRDGRAVPPEPPVPLASVRAPRRTYDADCESDADTSNPTFRTPLVSLPLSATQLANQFVTLLVAFIAANESQLDRINEENVEHPAELSAGDAPIDESLLAPVVFFVAVWAVASLLLPKATSKTRVNRFLVETLLEKELASYSLICNILKFMKETDESVCDSYYLLLAEPNKIVICLRIQKFQGVQWVRRYYNLKLIE